MRARVIRTGRQVIGFGERAWYVYKYHRQMHVSLHSDKPSPEHMQVADNLTSRSARLRLLKSLYHRESKREMARDEKEAACDIDPPGHVWLSCVGQGIRTNPVVFTLSFSPTNQDLYPVASGTPEWEIISTYTQYEMKLRSQCCVHLSLRSL
jgi:hypothetical protein